MQWSITGTFKELINNLTIIIYQNCNASCTHKWRNELLSTGFRREITYVKGRIKQRSLELRFRADARAQVTHGARAPPATSDISWYIYTQIRILMAAILFTFLRLAILSRRFLQLLDICSVSKEPFHLYFTFKTHTALIFNMSIHQIPDNI